MIWTYPYDIRGWEMTGGVCKEVVVHIKGVRGVG